MPNDRYFVEIEGKKIRVPRVTTITKFVSGDPGGLMHWAWQAGYDGKTLEEARSAADVGKIVHAMIEAYVRGQGLLDLSHLEEDLRKCAERSFGAFIEWKREQTEFEPVAQEVKLISRKHMFGGRADIVRFNGRRALMDFKTGAAVYPEHLAQDAAYGIAWDENHPDEPIEWFEILRISQKHGSFHHSGWPASEMEPAKRAFLLAREMYELNKQLKGML